MCKPPVVVDTLTLKHDGDVNIKLQVNGGKMSFNGVIFS
jgi:phage baseplate assembly protein gpV